MAGQASGVSECLSPFSSRAMLEDLMGAADTVSAEELHSKTKEVGGACLCTPTVYSLALSVCV